MLHLNWSAGRVIQWWHSCAITSTLHNLIPRCQSQMGVWHLQHDADKWAKPSGAPGTELLCNEHQQQLLPHSSFAAGRHAHIEWNYFNRFSTEKNTVPFIYLRRRGWWSQAWQREDSPSPGSGAERDCCLLSHQNFFGRKALCRLSDSSIGFLGGRTPHTANHWHRGLKTR